MGTRRPRIRVLLPDGSEALVSIQAGGAWSSRPRGGSEPLASYEAVEAHASRDGETVLGLDCEPRALSEVVAALEPCLVLGVEP